MGISTFLLCLSWLGLGSLAYTPLSTWQTDGLAAAAFAGQAHYHSNSYQSTSTCNAGNAIKRKEWSALPVSDRKAYTAAVLCLMNLPSKSDPATVPGARSRYDDFLATHILQSAQIHYTFNFLAWHRYFVFAYEKALRDECGYTGYQPYWNWGKSAEDPLGSPYFDGGEGSMSGNGVYVPHNYSAEFQALPAPNGTTPGTTPPPMPSPFPAGTGGGCIQDGPFKGANVNLGPVRPTFPGVQANGDGLSYNPRCITRDITNYKSSQESKDSDIFDLLAQSKTFYNFTSNLQGNLADPSKFGAHGANHFVLAGDPGGDVFVSPGDPAFYIHHGNVDRVWWIWQNLDPKSRMFQTGGTITPNNTPPSRNGTLDDVIDLGVCGPPPLKIRELVDTMAGPFCYMYV